MTVVPITSPDLDAAEVAWFAALCSDDYRYLGVPDGALRSSWAHCSEIVTAAEELGFRNILCPSSYQVGQDTLSFVAGCAPITSTINLLAAVRCGDPVMFFEHKRLYMTKGEVPADGDHVVEFGQAAVLREGSDLTIVAIGLMVGRALEAAEALAADGIEATVIDPRTLFPLDLETIVASVERTGRLLTADEAVVRGGFASYIALRATGKADLTLWHDLAFVAVESVFFATSRNTLRNYYVRAEDVLGTIPNEVPHVQRIRPSRTGADGDVSP